MESDLRIRKCYGKPTVRDLPMLMMNCKNLVDSRSFEAANSEHIKSD